MIDTPEGERCVDSLAIGDLVRTGSGGLKPVRWIGRWAPEGDHRQSWAWHHVPVKVMRGALASGLPYSDLYVSDEHCLYVDGLLIPAIDLVNGRSISKEVPIGIDALEYFHIELDEHDVVFANGLSAETYRFDSAVPPNFDNYEEYMKHYGEPTVKPAFAPIASNASRLKDIQSRFRSAIAPIYDKRQPLEVIRDQLTDRAFRKAA